MVASKSGIIVGRNAGHVNTPIASYKPKGDLRKGKNPRTQKKFVKSLIREVTGFAPYERRVLELLKNSKDKRARKVSKKRLGTFGRAKAKVEELSNIIAESRRAH
ncbi:ribosomal protein L36 [Mycoemilia scoparia]|uniref:60S ribosomal protein L36 n=1 Tax=Mycoemilia scoparia TaxID=417184 RepID=A0A9W7ZZ65_9FUNG|nr:ribosomal protein L36 [Mycoemilia scoparia]